MNLFIIPSWYPSRVQPLSGIFTSEQAHAIADLAPDINVIVSLWGQGDGHLPLRHPANFLRSLVWRYKQPTNRIVKNNSVFELFNPCLYWNHRVPWASAAQLFEVNLKNFVLAESHFGRIDLIHAHVSYPGGYIASLLAEKFKTPFVLTEHMSPFPFPDLIREGRPLPTVSKAYREATATIAVSPSLAEDIFSFGYSRPEVIPNLVDERVFYPSQCVSKKIIFFTLCGITEQKGIDLLLDAIYLWNPHMDEFELRIGGDGPQRANYEAKAKALGLSNRVRWLGPISRQEAPALFRDCHVYVMPSRHETFGVVFAEAVACGKPIIATRCGGPESIVTSENGKLVDVGDVPSLAAAMADMAARLSEYDPVAIRKDFEERFSRRAVVGQLQALYSRVLGLRE